MLWAKQFWIFWKLTKAIKINKIMILAHMDNICFFAIRSRSNQKVVTSEGFLPRDFRLHHKLHIGKELNIVLIAFLPTDNDITKGVLAKRLSLVRSGRIPKAKRIIQTQVQS